jgi:hypothetical protein
MLPLCLLLWSSTALQDCMLPLLPPLLRHSLHHMLRLCQPPLRSILLLALQQQLPLHLLALLLCL